MQQKEKLNELIGAIHEKDELVDSQEEFLIKENKKHVKVKNAYAQEVEKNENLTKELSILKGKCAFGQFLLCFGD
jgi:serine phosphatase RsbU (regulator of sigma subunit)